MPRPDLEEIGQQDGRSQVKNDRNGSTTGGDVAVFIDFENIYISVRSKYDSNPNFESIMDLCQRYGRVTIARAYADWYRYPRVTNGLYANAIEPMYVPTYHYTRDRGRTGDAIKNSVDMHLCIDMMKTLHAYDNIDTYVLVTGDRDFIPLINATRQQGKRTVVIGVAEATASHLAQSADEFLYYSQVDSDLDDGASSESQDPFKVLVEAVKLARQRNAVSTLAGIKLLMLELMPKFDESQLKDRQGRNFGKFKAFVREAERRKLVKIFTSGSVNEVLLPDEDPYAVSRFAAPEAETEAPAEPRKKRSSRGGSRGSSPTTESTVSRTNGTGAVEDDEDEEDDGPDFSATDWAVFEEAMLQFDEPALFIQVYDALRNLRNKDIMNLSNHDLKRMIKRAINEGMLIRTTRGPHAYYHIDKSRPFMPASS